VTAHRELQMPPPIPRLRWPPTGCSVATAAHNDAEAARTAAARAAAARAAKTPSSSTTSGRRHSCSSHNLGLHRHSLRT
jgi:hypothetical protein